MENHFAETAAHDKAAPRKSGSAPVAPVRIAALSAFVLAALLALTGCAEGSGGGAENADGGAARQASYDAIVSASDDCASTVNGLSDGLCSYTGAGQDAAAAEGDDYSLSPVAYIASGAYAADKSLASENGKISGTAIDGFAALISKSGINGIIVKDSALSIQNAAVAMEDTGADGSDTCDFTGKGAALAAYGASAELSVSDSTFTADGVASLAAFVDDGASALFERCSLSSSGGTIYAGYVNSPEQTTMVAPPWVLGIAGTARGTNLLGTASTMTVVDSFASAANWGVLSVDMGSDATLNVVNSTVELTGSDRPIQADGTFNAENPYTARSGYGTYVIGNATETFLGATFKVGTYATIFTGGSAYYGNLEGGKTYDILKANGATHTTYTATADKVTTISSDTFGFMAHQGANTATLDGIEVNSAFTSFLVKSGCDNVITVKNGTKLNAGNGILLQLMDNDDSTTAFDAESFSFGTTHEEYAGFPTQAVQTDAGTQAGADDGGSNTTLYSIEDCTLEGSLFNGIGWDANELSAQNVKPMTLRVALSGASSLTGAIASTSCIHASYEGLMLLKESGIAAFDDEAQASAFAEEYQACTFTIGEYFNIGQVANLVKSNGLNRIDVTVDGASIWTVSATSLISSLSIGENAKVIVADGATLTVNGTRYSAGTYTAADFPA